MGKNDKFKDMDVAVFLDNPDVETFVGKNYAHYQEIWLQDFKKHGNNALKMLHSWHINYLALLLWPAWFGYRKMMKFTVLLSILLGLLSFAEEYWSFESGMGLFAAVVIIALKSKSFYFMHVVERMHAIDQMPDREMREVRLQKEGGVSVLYAVLGTLFFFICQIAAIYAAEILRGAHPAA